MAFAEKISKSINKYLRFNGQVFQVTNSVIGRTLYRTGLNHGRLLSDSDPIYQMLIREFGARRFFLHSQMNVSIGKIQSEIIDLRAQVESVEIQLATLIPCEKPELPRPDLAKIEEISPLNPHAFENRSAVKSPAHEDLAQAKEILHEWRQREKKVKELLADQALWDLNESNYIAYVNRHKELSIQLQEKKAALEKAEAQIGKKKSDWNDVSGGTLEIFQVFWTQYRSGYEDGCRKREVSLARKAKRGSAEPGSQNENPPATKLEAVHEL